MVDQTAIFAPVFAMFSLTFLVWIYLYAQRIPFICKNKFSPDQLKLNSMEFARLFPPAVSNPSDNLKNLCELPILFYALVNYLFVMEQVDGVYLVAAWIFVVFRSLHSVIHCTINRILIRFYLYLVAALSLWFMIGRAGYQYIN